MMYRNEEEKHRRAEGRDQNHLGLSNTQQHRRLIGSAPVIHAKRAQTEF